MMPVIAVLAWALSALSVAAFAGRAWWVLDVVASFRPQLALLLLTATILLALGRWWRTCTVLAAITMVNLAVIAPLFFGPPRARSADLRVISFNLLSSNESFEEVIDFISGSGADLVVLHEASLPWEVALADADLPYDLTMTRHPDDIFGTLVLAPAGSVVESYGFRIDDPRAVAIGLPDGVDVLAIHPLSPYTRSRAINRDRQLHFAQDWVNEQRGPVVVVGDFNATPWSYPYRRLLAETALLDSARGFGVGWSYPVQSNPLLWVAIDHLLYSPELSVADRRLGPALGSDHFALTVDLATAPSD
jgi:endonuclease/exonuclease/phosphatase (EEP) superfamily protein YafD